VQEMMQLNAKAVMLVWQEVNVNDESYEKQRCAYVGKVK
jgi:hypothetical protein